jgi:hypothetical protein
MFINIQIITKYLAQNIFFQEIICYINFQVDSYLIFYLALARLTSSVWKYSLLNQIFGLIHLKSLGKKDFHLKDIFRGPSKGDKTWNPVRTKASAYI